MTLIPALLLIALVDSIAARPADQRVQAKVLSPSEIRLVISADDIAITPRLFEGEMFDIVHFSDDEETISASSSPPIITRFIAIPAGSKVNAKAEKLSIRTIRTGRRPLPEHDDPGASSAVFPGGSTSYQADLVSVGRTLEMRGVNIVPLKMAPVVFNSESSEYSIAEKMEVILNIESPPGAAEPAVSVGSAADRIFNQNGVLNLRRDQPPTFIPAGRYLVLAREECLPYAIPLLEWKRQTGYEVEVCSYTSEELYDEAGDPIDGVEEEIRSRIRDVYRNDLEAGREPYDYILIIGGREESASGGTWLFPSFVDIPTMVQTPPHADYMFGVMGPDEVDFVSDIAVGRITAGTVDRMELAVARQLAFEKTPYMGDTSWFHSAGVFTQRWADNFSQDMILTVRWGEQVLRNKGYRDIRVQEAPPENDDGGQVIGPVLAQMFNEGRGILIGRAQVNYWFDNLRGVQDNVIFPFGIDFCGHGEFIGNWLFGTGSRDHLKGPVVWTTGWGNPQTIYSNIVWTTLVQGVFNYDLPIGWARAMVGLTLPVALPGRDDGYHQYQTDLDLYGDPGLQPWIGTPQRVRIERSSLRVGQNVIDVRALRSGDDTPIAGARVTLYQPGEIPDGVEYADWRPDFMISGTTGADGRVRFNFSRGLQEGRLYVTVTGRKILPVWDEVDVRSGNTPLLTVENLSISGGGSLQAGARVSLNITARNQGTTAHNISARVVSRTTDVEVVSGDVSFGNIGAGATGAGDRPITISIAASTPDDMRPPVELEFNCQEGSNNASLILDIEAPRLRVVQLEEQFPIGQVFRLAPEVTNYGRLPTEARNAVLLPLDWSVIVTDSIASYNVIEQGETAGPAGGTNFAARARQGAIPGSAAKVGLIFSLASGVIDTLKFDIAFEAADNNDGRNAPDGPDNYGYICLDSRDTLNWTGAPAYDWFEICGIDPNPLVEGDTLTMDHGMDGGSALVNLEFPFRFYGYEYHAITVCSNGFIAIGDQRRQINYQNTPINLASGGAAGMIAPFWDHLTFYNSINARVVSYADAASGRHIIEWYKMNICNSGVSLVTFQAQLYDPEEHPTITGDSQIQFIYKEVSNLPGDRDQDIPFASVGISSPDGTSGLSVNYDSSGTAATRLVRNNSTLLFVTSPSSFKGRPATLELVISDSSDARPLEGVITNLTAAGFKQLSSDTTDENGEATLAEAPPGYYFINLSRPGYNKLNIGVHIESGQNQHIAASLPHPEIVFTPEVLVDSIRTEFQMIRRIGIINRGNGTLNCSLSVSGNPVVRRISLPNKTIPAGDIGIYDLQVSSMGRERGDYDHIIRVVDDEAQISAEIHYRVNIDPNNDVSGRTELPTKWGLSDIYPNPFNNHARFSVSTEVEGDITLELYDASGRLVETIWKGWLKTGEHEFALKAKNLAPGLYLVRMQGGKFIAVKKLILLN